jgi:phosphopantetheinyl transferase
MLWIREQVPDIEAPMRAFSGHIFNAATGDFDSLTSRSSCLSLSELKRAENYLRRPDAVAFIARRVFLRETLAAKLGVSPYDLTLDVSRNGKPELRHGKDHLWFSQSATTGRTVVALSRNGEVGIDIERLDRPLDFGRIANRWFTPQEVFRIEQCSSDDTMRFEFMRIWTAREAAAKLTGEGMALALPRHESFVDPMRVALRNGGLPKWIDVRIESPYLVSVAWSAIECPPPTMIGGATEPPGHPRRGEFKR